MISNMRKLFERIILDRLNDIIEYDEGGPRLAQLQYGLRKGRPILGAIDFVVDQALKTLQYGRERVGVPRYCAANALDIKNAFNTACWAAIERALRSKGVTSTLLSLLRSYLSKKVLLNQTNEAV